MKMVSLFNRFSPLTATAPAVLLHAEGGRRGNGQPKREEGVSNLQQDVVRQVDLESPYANSHR